MQSHRAFRPCLSALALILLPWAAQAGDPLAVGEPFPIEPVQDALQVPFKAVNEFGREVDPGQLAALRGGDGSLENLIDVDGTVTDNTANRINSGSNAISDGAFSNSNGINTVIQNTGTNVLIQNAMIVTVDFMDPVP